MAGPFPGTASPRTSSPSVQNEFWPKENGDILTMQVQFHIEDNEFWELENAWECYNGQGSASSSSAISLGRRTWTLIGDSLCSCQIKCIQNWLGRFGRLMPLSIDVNCTCSIEGKQTMYMSHNNCFGTALAVNKIPDSTQPNGILPVQIATYINFFGFGKQATWFDLIWPDLTRLSSERFYKDLWSVTSTTLASKGDCGLHKVCPERFAWFAWFTCSSFIGNWLAPSWTPFLPWHELFWSSQRHQCTSPKLEDSPAWKQELTFSSKTWSSKQRVGSCICFAYLSNAVLAWAHNRAEAGWQHCPTFLLPYLQISVTIQSGTRKITQEKSWNSLLSQLVPSHSTVFPFKKPQLVNLILATNLGKNLRRSVC